MIVALISIVACLLAALSIWAAQVNQNNGVGIHSLIDAGINMIAPAILTLGAGILAFGIKPRITNLIAYGVLGWSFLISLISSGLNLNHWFLDTSVLHQIAPAPAANPNWKTDTIVIFIGILLCLIGVAAFNKRDLQSE